MIFRHEPVKISARDKQDVCLGYDDNGYAPIGFFVTKDDLMTMGVIEQ